LFTQSNLAELGSPVAPNPVSDTSSNSNRDNNCEEDSNARCTVLLVELIVLACALLWDILVHFHASLAGCDGDTAVARWSIIFDNVLLGADLRMIWR
jgi:hypothetical protein